MERVERAAVEDGGRNRAVGAGRADRAVLTGWKYFHPSGSDYLGVFVII